MNITKLSVAGIEEAIVAMRLPMKSFDKTDSVVDRENDSFYLGENDEKLCMNLIRSGASHRKHIRLIDAWFEITAPRYFWTEFDTYRYGVDKVSESTMHTILKDKVSLECFEVGLGTIEDMMLRDSLSETLYVIEDIKEMDIPDVDKIRMIKKILPESFLQTRIVKCSYEALRAMYHDRKNHRLKEWRDFCKYLEEALPFSEFVTEE